MSCRIVRGDIFQTKMQTLVNPVNCVGVMGAGLAQKFKVKYPYMFDKYVDMCREGRIRPGKPYLWISADMSSRILLFPTKDHYRDKSYRFQILDGIRFLGRTYIGAEITSLAVPALGCGLGGIQWEDFRDELQNSLDDLGIPVELYAPPKNPPTNQKLGSTNDGSMDYTNINFMG